jgi:1-acyl-sn-glycerol-3-phosphate acyltransferase
MIYPQKNPLIKWFFGHYINFILERNFHEIRFDQLTIDINKPILLLANHFSWWDGFILYRLNQLRFKKKFHIMILEETVKKVSFMKYLGAFSIKKNSRDVITSLNFAVSLLNDPKNLVLIYPQGKLYSNFSDRVVFEKGLSRIMQQAVNPIQIVFAVTFVENFKHKKPLVNVYLQKQAITVNMDELQNAYQVFYSAAKAGQTQIAF